MNFSQGHSGKKVHFCEFRACFPKEKHRNSHKKMCEIHELFVLALSLGWFAGATPDFGECALVPVFVPGEHANVPSVRFFVPGEHPNVPSFRFSFRGNIRTYPPFWKPPFWVPPKCPKPRKSPKESPGPLAPRPPESLERVSKSLFETFSRLCPDFVRPRNPVNGQRVPNS